MTGGRITTSKGRLFAFKLRTLRNRRTGKKVWYVGLSTSRYFWLDLNTPNPKDALALARILRDRLKTTVYIFKSAKSFHLITKKPLNRSRWRREYAWWLNNFSDDMVCHPFCLCCLRYNRATIRVSKKNGNIPFLWRIVGVEDKGKPLISTYPSLHESRKEWIRVNVRE